MGRTQETVVIGAGQAGLTTSYWLTQLGVEHQVLERRDTLGGAFQDRWDSFYMNTPNLSLDLPGMPFYGGDRDAFIPRDAAVNLFRRYAELISAPVHTGVDLTRLSALPDGGFHLVTSLGSLRARNVVLATGAYQVPKIPTLAAKLPAEVTQLHTHEYRNPEQLPDGAVLIVGTGQSGGQIAEELHDAGRDVHLSVSIVPEAPRRYRGQDLIYWMLETGKHGPDYGVNALTTEALPSPAARFAPNPLLSGIDGGHSIHLRELGRRGMHLHGHLESIDDGDITFSDDLPERLAAVESAFGQRSRRAIDAYIAAAGIDAPEQAPLEADDWLPNEPAQVNLADANITSVLWASGYKLDFTVVDLPLVDEWGYPKHSRGVTEISGLFVVGLPWLTRHYSSIVGGVGLDSEYVAGRVAAA
ncbi:putative flavoprotein involved in K+ transport [Paenarthrobacter nitroguajacolicus]|uniref:flavin-containing monooxygenase n=1 Tax=Paenarthrobacter nitroguajacolicus TaxID=211146 RepID=UPI00285CA869|nr:NAD(P)/FAD-dependent oxidoreductase [Paenarthrobacter nitroguajacolicus]MDR6986002.1 putative flavoprotein involved in K+ transport [Paenarthrobacter nitroguajacolicus]